MKRIFLILTALLTLNATAQKTYQYESVPDDPMHTRIYTLDNGLKVYLSVNKNQPRIQTYIAVRTGSKNDPAETTGLAHYLEHLLFKGTHSFGTTNYEAERPMLDEIRDLYEVYRTKTDPQERAAIYHRIDSISGQASKIAIANEYDKLMASIGANGTNAHTSEDETVYQEDIPSNEIENWAIVQSDRFQNMVIRGFHTELEAVYEEYNRGLTNDFWKIFENINRLLFPHHPYGTQTTIGTQEHLKNPSIVNIENYFHKYYVPNNVAICMSGDMDMDETIAIIDKYFGSWKRGADVEPLHFDPEPAMTSVVSKEVFGLEQEMVVIGWRLPGRSNPDFDAAEVMNAMLQNGQSGLIDLDLVQQQRVLAAEAFAEGMTDYGEMLLIGIPKDGQTLDEVKDLLLAEVGKLQRGEWDEALLEGTINNMKLNDMKGLESNVARASAMYASFIHQRPWQDQVSRIERLSRLTKQDIVAYANRHLSTTAYALIYKRQGQDPNEKKIDKPAISPIEMNRDKTSDFVRTVTSRPVRPIEPVFVDFEKDMSVSTLKNGSQMLYKQNTQNGTFSLTYLIQRGEKADHLLSVAAAYFDYLGTRRMSAAQIQAELYRLACEAGISCGTYGTSIYVRGLAENQEAAVRLLEEWIRDLQPDDDIYAAMVEDMLTARELEKTNENACLQRLNAYAMYGPVNAYTDIASAEEMRSARPKDLVKRLQSLGQYPQIVRYYGPSTQQEIAALIERTHKVRKKVQSQYTFVQPLAERYPQQQTPVSEVFLAPYESKAVKLQQYSNNGQPYDLSLEPQVTLFNEYFGGSMNAVVFQELREARGLAYSAGAVYATASHPQESNTFITQIGSQNDKLADCLDVFHDINEHMPLAQNSFDLARDAVLKRMATQRHVGLSVLTYYQSLRAMGLDHDPSRDIYNQVRTLTLADLQRFAAENVAGRTYRYCVLGDEQNLDMKKLESLGTVHRLTLRDIFGY